MFGIYQQGLWECWELEDGKIVLVDLTDIHYLNTNANRYMGKKIKKKLGFALDRRSADNMYQQFTTGSVPIEVDK